MGLMICGFAQPVIQYNSTHSIGNEAKWYYISGTMTTLSQFGANITWDLSANSCIQIGTFSAVSPANTPFGSSFPTANLAYKLDGSLASQGISYVYFIDTLTGIQKIGEVVSSIPDILVDYEETLKYPLNYTNTFSGTSQTSGGSPTNYTCTYDAFGTLNINAKTYNNVVRISSTTGDITWYITSPVIYPLIFITAGNYFYNEPTTISGIDLFQPNPQITVYPNPASEFISLNINPTLNSSLTLTIYNSIGSLVKMETLEQNQRQINVGDLSNGIYMLKIKSDNFTGNQKLIIQR